MSATPEDCDRPKKAPIQVDLYGIKVDGVTPRPDKEPPPRTWRQVGRRVNLSLMRFCTQTAELLADIPATVRAVVRGIGKLPGAISRRVGRAHDKADRVLAGPAVGAVAVAQADPLPSPDEALVELEAVVNGMRAQGLVVSLHRLPTGQWTILAGLPELEPALKAAGMKAIAGEVLPLTQPDQNLSAIAGVKFAQEALAQAAIRHADLRPENLALAAEGPATVVRLQAIPSGQEIRLADFGLPPTVERKLIRAGYSLLIDIHAAGPEAIAALPGIGPKSFQAIEAALARQGLRWPRADS